MKNQLALFLFILSGNICNAQTFSIEFGPVFPYAPPIESSFDNEFESTILDLASLPDSVFLRQKIRSAGTSVQKYEAQNIGLEGGLNLHWQLKKNIGITTGIHAKAYSFNRSFDATGSLFNVTIIDTVAAIDNPPNPISKLTCDRFSNNSTNLNSSDLIDKFEIIDLYLPLKLNYSVWDGEINFFAGTYFSVPIYSKNTFEFFRIESEEINNETVCEFVNHVRKSDSFETFTRLNYGISFGIDYQLSPRISISLSADQRFTKLLSSDNFLFAEPEPLLNERNTRLSFLSATAKFTFNPKQNTSQSTDNQ